MYRNNSRLQALFLLIYFSLVLGVVLGAVFYMKSDFSQSSINDTLLSAAKTMSENPDKWRIIKNIFISNAICAGVIFFAAFFKFGIAAVLAVLVRYGFIIGFSSASAIGTFGAKGELIITAFVLDMAISALMLVIFGAVSVYISIEPEKKYKKILFFFLIFLISIFCAVAFSRGYLTTTFMKLVYPKIA